MKLLKFACIFVLISVLSACNNDDDDNSPSGDGIIGSWKVTEIQYTGNNIASQQGVEVEVPFTGKGVDMNLSITFNNNMNYTTSGDYAILLTTNFFGQSIEQRYENFGFVGAGTWREEGNNIIFANSSGSDTLTVLENSGNKLKLQWDFSTTIEEQGTVNTFETNGTYTFERQ